MPGQILERCEGTYRGIAREDYNARELEVKRGDEVYGLKSLNGWMWCERTSNGQAGW
ncbi:SH3 domain-containing protein, partial [Klebsiella pneumoniae]